MTQCQHRSMKNAPASSCTRLGGCTDAVTIAHEAIDDDTDVAFANGVGDVTLFTRKIEHSTSRCRLVVEVVEAVVCTAQQVEGIAHVDRSNFGREVGGAVCQVNPVRPPSRSRSPRSRLLGRGEVQLLRRASCTGAHRRGQRRRTLSAAVGVRSGAV